jgi:tetratricopeptide (TPR) repeat protein
LFRPQRRPLLSTFSAVMLGLIFVSSIVLNSILKGEIEPVSFTTPTPTRAASSYVNEGEALFQAGSLQRSIDSYLDALVVDPENVSALVELARLQTYFGALNTEAISLELLSSARENIDLAIAIDDLSSDAHAVRAFVYDWSASWSHTVEEREEFLAVASQAAVRATQLDANNALAFAYRAEVLGDQFQLLQANDLIDLALSIDPNSMDVHRIKGNLLESQGFYSAAIDEYRQALEFMPNYTYLHLKIGQNYRQLKLYDQALEYFDRAATINRTLGINDPLPYVAIAKTYTQEGEFFVAARNAETALSFNPQDPVLYGELGLIRFRARNYEGSMPVLKCATIGCSAAENEDEGVAVQGLQLNNSTVVFYYTYGAVLAALNFCDEAEPVLAQVQAVYAEDELISDIVQESLFICETFRTGGSIPTSTPPPTEDMQDMEDG